MFRNRETSNSSSRRATAFAGSAAASAARKIASACLRSVAVFNDLVRVRTLATVGPLLKERVPHDRRHRDLRIVALDRNLDVREAVGRTP